jgi:hypothetical protein
MTTTQVVGLQWKRGVEDRYPVNNDASFSYGAYDKDTDGPIISGMVAGVRTGTGNEAVPAGATAAQQGFHGIFFSEVSDELDESAGGAPPTIFVGPALLFVRKRALVANQSYAAGNFLTYGTQAGGKQGRLIPEGATGAAAAAAAGTPSTRVARVQEVQADGILVRLLPYSV